MANIYFYTKDDYTIMIDNTYLFTDDTIWFGADGGRGRFRHGDL